MSRGPASTSVYGHRKSSLQRSCAICNYCRNSRPRWTTLHPDHWTVLEVAEWLNSVAEEYKLDQESKLTLLDSFCDVDGRRLATMTSRNFTDLDPAYGNLLFNVFHNIVAAGNVSHFTRTLTPISELEAGSRNTRSTEHGTEPLQNIASQHVLERDDLLSEIRKGFGELQDEMADRQHPANVSGSDPSS